MSLHHVSSVAAPPGPHWYSPDPGEESALRLAEATARRVSRDHQDPAIDNDDVLSEAYLAALLAHRSWQEGKGCTHKTHVITRTRWAIKEFYRQSDWLSRHDRNQEQALDAALERATDPAERRRLEAGRLPSRQIPVSLEAILGEDDAPVAEDLVAALFVTDDLAAFLDRVEIRSLLALLPERQRTAVLLTYWQDMTHPAAGKRMGISKSRVYQILEDAYTRLRPVLRERDLVPHTEDVDETARLSVWHAVTDGELWGRHENGDGPTAIARRCGVAVTTVRDRLRRLGVLPKTQKKPPPSLEGGGGGK